MKSKKHNTHIPITGILLLASLLLTGCASSPKETSGKKTFELTDASHILSQMTIEEKVAQIFVIEPDTLLTRKNRNAPTEMNSVLKEAITKYPVGGFVLFRNNIENPSQLRKFTKALSDSTPIPPVLAVDEEGGKVSRIARHENFYLPKFKSMGAVGQTRDKENARGAGQIIGSYLASFGFTLDFAPVVDVNTNPENIVIGDRAFGDNPELVAEMGKAFLSGLHSTGVKGCIKHFPGHGDTKGDTHSDYVAVTKSWEELNECELIPFKKNLPYADCVMIAHVTCTSIDTDYPASLSKKLIREKLREELGYQGIVISDSLRMGAIVKNYGAGEACVLAFLAGNDLLLMPKDFYEGYEAVLKAVQSGRISEELLDDSVLRILHLKGYK